MTIEEQLKEYILDRYKSLRNFVNTSGIDVPYTTIDGIFKRGIYNASINNVLKLCKVLNISADELADGHIVPLTADPVIEYAKKLSKLSPENLNNVLKYIDFLEREETE